MQRLPPETQTLYAEFLEHLVAMHAHRTIGYVPGCFTTKSVKGELYYYFQYSDPGGVSRQAYVGKQSPTLEKVVEAYARGRSERNSDTERLQRLSAHLRAGQALLTDAASARVLKALADSEVFHLGGVLIGTHAFAVLGNLLGVRWDSSHLKTQDIDIAGTDRMGIVVPDIQVDIPEVLQSLQMGFLPIPALNPKQPSTAFKVRGQAIRVDFLTPAHGARRDHPVFINRFRVAAQPLKFLDYLLESVVQGAIVNSGGVLVNVPNPARYAFHKLLVSRSRELSSQTKAEKDLHQAVQLIEVLVEDRPGDLVLAWQDLRKRGRGWMRPVTAALLALEKRHSHFLDKVVATVPALKADLNRSLA